jgi:uncharacterized protein YbbC (DUF1343 family)
VLAERGFDVLKGKRVGFVGNHTSRLADGSRTVDALFASETLGLKRLFSPEHGAFGKYDEEIANEIDPATGLEIISLYGENRSPSQESLNDLDTIVFELQDVGARFYTYSSTLLLLIDAAHASGKKILVLDRPNPISGSRFEGSFAAEFSFVAPYSIPIRHGLTLGELALLYASETNRFGTVDVVSCGGLTREMWHDDTGLQWLSPSPAMKSLDTAIVYPGVCLLEQTNVSVGRGTDSPFQRVGAPWIDGESWVHFIAGFSLPGVVITSTVFTPASSKFAQESCYGLQIEVTDRNVFQPVSLGYAMLITLRDLHPQEFALKEAATLIANSSLLDSLLSCESYQNIFESFLSSINEWMSRIERHLLYN